MATRGRAAGAASRVAASAPVAAASGRPWALQTCLPRLSPTRRGPSRPPSAQSAWAGLSAVAASWFTRRFPEILYASADLETDIREALERAARSLRLEADLPEHLAASAAALIRRQPLAALFSRQPQRQVFTEWELCNDEGKLFRLDRVVVDKDCVTVIDWKTGAER